MRMSKRAMLAAGLIMGAAVMTGCTVSPGPAATAGPAAQATAQPATAQPSAEVSPQAAESAGPEAEGESAPLRLTVDGEETGAHAIEEEGMLLLPLEKTAEALGWKAAGEETEEENGVKRVVSLEKDESRITVSWQVSDNTVKSISWQKDGLLIPVDTRLTTRENVVYVPAAFFEEAMDARIEKAEGSVRVTLPQAQDTPETTAQDVGENG